LRSVKVGVSASLDPARTVHTQGFLNSVELFNRTHDFPLHLVWTDDGASARPARAAARQMIASGVDIVVGHFASDAAASALEMYQDSGTPVLLPAATLPRLTRQARVYRVCQPDSALVACLAGAVAEQGYDDVGIEHDGSEHGRYIAHALSARLPVREQDSAPSCGAVVYCGRYESARTYLLRSEMCSDHRDVWLTDDALCDPLRALVQGLSMRVRVVSYRPAEEVSGGQLVDTYRRRYGAEPGPYFPATIASLDICLGLDADTDLVKTLDSTVFPTAFGEIGFRRGESGFGSYQVFDLNRRHDHAFA